MNSDKEYKAIVAGVSAGGMKALKILLTDLPASFSLPIIIVQHVSPESGNTWITILDKTCKLKIKEADEKEKIEKGTVYIAPPNYHLLIEKDNSFSLSVDKRVSYARPSIDVLFETAAIAYKNELIGVILTGANRDGTNGLKAIKEMGGLTIVQDPQTADAREMPASAIREVQVDYILPLEGLKEVLIKLAINKSSPDEKSN
ncbi:MAG TPA: chemotaxis protein CheB [Cyclobacteriaceae bacterium]